MENKPSINIRLSEQEKARLRNHPLFANDIIDNNTDLDDADNLQNIEELNKLMLKNKTPEQRADIEFLRKQLFRNELQEDIINDIASKKVVSQSINENDSLQSENKQTKEGFFYIIKTPDTPMSVYKIGKTTHSDPNKRFCQYPKGVIVKYTIAVSDADSFEDYMMRQFKVQFERKMEYGMEYYKGDIIQMIDVTHQVWMKIGMSSTSVTKSTVDMERYKPNGFQVFVNDWLVKQVSKPTLDDAYIAYVSMLRDDFGTTEYAEKEPFITYMRYCEYDG
jgi:hypothetical protein